MARRVEQVRDGHFDDAIHFTCLGCHRRANRRESDNRMQHEPADGNVQRRQPTDHSDAGAGETDFLFRLAQRGALDGLAGIDRTTRQ